MELAYVNSKAISVPTSASSSGFMSWPWPLGAIFKGCVPVCECVNWAVPMSVTTVLRPFARSELLLLSVLLYNESAQKYATFSAAQLSWQAVEPVCLCASVDVSLRCNKLALGMYLCACVSDAAWQIARLKGLRLAIDKFMILMSYVVYQSSGKALGLCHVRLSLCVSVCVSVFCARTILIFTVLF